MSELAGCWHRDSSACHCACAQRISTIEAKLVHSDKLRNELVGALQKTIEVAFDGPSEPKGTGHEFYYAWRNRTEKEVKEILFKAKEPM